MSAAAAASRSSRAAASIPSHRSTGPLMSHPESETIHWPV